jgi:dienelactone hydrolase
LIQGLLAHLEVVREVRLDLRIQFFTSRGIAVVDVNYAGSTGYGRNYRERLTGQWGVADVADCLDAARFLIQAGSVDGRRLVISGPSAGGFTALGALASENLFAVGVSRFGIADLETFRQQAPKFQAHELDRLVGPYPEAAAAYRARSPLHTVNRIARPVLLVHGLADTVVPPIQAHGMAEALERRGIRYVLLAFPGEGTGSAVPRASGVRSRPSCPSTLQRWGWRPARPTRRWPPIARPRPARSIICLGGDCPSSALHGAVGSSQVRVVGVSVWRGLVRCSRAWWNDCETAHGSVMIRTANGGSGRDPWND